MRNPLLGTRGATRTFGPQKGVAPDQVEVLEEALARLADVVSARPGLRFPGNGRGWRGRWIGFRSDEFLRCDHSAGFRSRRRDARSRSGHPKGGCSDHGRGQPRRANSRRESARGRGAAGAEVGKRVYAIVGSSSESATVRNLFDGLCILAREATTPQESVARAGELLQERARELGRTL